MQSAVRACLAVSSLATVLTLSSAAFAQALETPAPSPKARAEQRVGLTDFAIDYSSPGVKGRKIWGALIEFDKVWRTGANATTKLTSSGEFSFGGKTVAAGTYALLTLPGKNSWTVVLNSNLSQNGAQGYDAKTEVARISVKPAAAPLRERMTFIFANTTDDTTSLDLEWEKLRVSIPFKVATQAQMLTNIDKAMNDAWRPHFSAGRYLLESGGDIDRALTLLDQSIAIKATWWNNWIRAQALAKKGRAQDAVAAAEQAQTLGKGDNVYEGFFKDAVQKGINDWKKNKS